MKPPSDLILASASAYLRVLACKDYQSRAAAEREYQHLEAEIRRIESAGTVQKVVGGLHHAPLSMSAQEFTR